MASLLSEPTTVRGKNSFTGSSLDPVAGRRIQETQKNICRIRGPALVIVLNRLGWRRSVRRSS